MSLILIIIIIVMAAKMKKLKNADPNEQTLRPVPIRNRRNQGNYGSYGNYGNYSPQMIGKAAQEMSNTAENALRAEAEALLPRYEQSDFIQDAMKTIQECGKYGQLWDLEIADHELIITTMTDAMEGRVVLMEEYYDFQSLGYQMPSLESAHRLALALALQKKLGNDYGIDYIFHYNPEDDTHTMRNLTINYRRKQDKGARLRAPLE